MPKDKNILDGLAEDADWQAAELIRKSPRDAAELLNSMRYEAEQLGKTIAQYDSNLREYKTVSDMAREFFAQISGGPIPELELRLSEVNKELQLRKEDVENVAKSLEIVKGLHKKIHAYNLRLEALLKAMPPKPEAHSYALRLPPLPPGTKF